MITFKHYIIVSVIVTGLFFGNLFLWHSPILGLPVGIIFLLINGLVVGAIFLKNHTLGEKWLFGSLGILSLISILGSIFYYFYLLNDTIIFLLICFIEIFIGIFLFRNRRRNHENIENFVKKLSSYRPLSYLNITQGIKRLFTNKTLFLILATIFLDLVALIILWHVRTDKAIQSPWQVIPPYFFIIYILGTFSLITAIIFGKKSSLLKFSLIGHVFLTVAVALLVYKIGYGFDSFIHRAAEKQIFLYGTIDPKPLYYIGQYSLVTVLSKLFFFTSRRIDLLLVPVLTAVYLPILISSAFEKFFKVDKKISLGAGLLFLIVPFREFIVTTPQSLANFFALTVIFGSLLFLSETFSLTFLLILGAATFLVHPLSGIPIIFFLSFVLLFKNKKIKNLSIKIKALFTSLLFLLESAALPIAFLLSKYFTGLEISLSQSFTNQLANFWHNLSASLFELPRHFNLVLDAVYLYGFNWQIILIALSLIIFLIIRKKYKLIWIIPLVFTVIMINVFLLRTGIEFKALPEEEQINYPSRLFNLGIYFLMPLFLYGLIYFIDRARQRRLLIKIFSIFLLVFLLTSSLYLSYPRRDNYDPTHGFSVSKTDLQTVKIIDHDAEEQDYIVLANQTVSAAAFHELGFKKYYPLASQAGRAQFFYSTPTGSHLYQYFLQMIYKTPSKEVAREAMTLVGADKVYLVVNNYWWHAGHTILEAKKTADKWIAVDRGQIYIFVYTLE